MRRILFALFALLLSAAPARAQLAPNHIAVVGPAAEKLAAAWSVRPYQPERAYCGAFTLRADTLVVFDVAAPPERPTSVSWNTISFRCPSNTIGIHIHPPQDCNPVGTYCVFTDWREEKCEPSEQDQRALLSEGRDAGVVECGATVFGLYFPPRYVASIRSGR